MRHSTVVTASTGRVSGVVPSVGVIRTTIGDHHGYTAPVEVEGIVMYVIVVGCQGRGDACTASCDNHDAALDLIVVALVECIAANPGCISFDVNVAIGKVVARNSRTINDAILYNRIFCTFLDVKRLSGNIGTYSRVFDGGIIGCSTVVSAIFTCRATISFPPDRVVRSDINPFPKAIVDRSDVMKVDIVNESVGRAVSHMEALLPNVKNLHSSDDGVVGVIQNEAFDPAFDLDVFYDPVITCDIQYIARTRSPASR